MPQEVNTENLKDPNGPLPLADYVVRIDKVVQEPSSKWTCMDMFECEIIAPDVVSGPDGEVMAAGRQFRMYSSYTMKSLYYAKQNLKKLGIDLPATISVPTEDEVRTGAYKRIPEIQDETLLLRGKQIGMRLCTVPRYKTDTGDWRGKPVLDASGNKEIVGYNIEASLDNVTSGPDSTPY